MYPDCVVCAGRAKCPQNLNNLIERRQPERNEQADGVFRWGRLGIGWLNMWYLVSYMCPNCKRLHDVLVKAGSPDDAVNKFLESMGKTLPDDVLSEAPLMLMVSGVPGWCALAAIRGGDIAIQ